MSKQNQPLEQLQYPWPPNLTSYEAKILLGLSALEIVAAGVGFLVPAALWQSLGGAIVGLVVALIVLLSIKPLDALGGVSLPLYLVLRLLASRRKETIELPLIMGGAMGQVEVETWEGETLMIVGAED